MVFWLFAMLAYRHGYGSQFTDDWVAGLVVFHKQGWAGFKDSFGFTSLYYGHNLVFYGFYDLFGSNKLAWWLLFTGLHAANASFASLFFKGVFKKMGIDYYGLSAIACGALFLSSPFQTENVVWGATIHYAFGMLYLWLGLYIYRQYDKGRSMLWLLGYYLLFAWALVTIEVALVFPAVALVVFCCLWHPLSWGNTIKQMVRIALPCAFIIVAYFVSTYLLKGHWIGHYGESHLDFSLVETMGRYWQYFAKLLLYVHKFSFPIKDKVYSLLLQPYIAGALWIGFIGMLVWLYRRRKTIATALMAWMLICFLLLLPVLNMYFNYLNDGENDRLSYFASPFMLSLPVLVLGAVYIRWVMVYSLLAIVANLYFLDPQVLKWQYSANIQAATYHHPIFDKPGRKFMLNLPNYTQGVYVYRDFSRWTDWRELEGLPYHTQVVYIASAQVNSPLDSVIVVPIDSQTVRVQLSGWGRWFWRESLGLVHFEDKEISIVPDDSNLAYTLTIKHPQPGDELVYYASGTWHSKPL
ncbi:MAG: hypothetical protein SFW35_07440 [Chitinophagales bacterium]|nr:hypothetical protein [Chitinophagales bacterium]